VPAQASAKRARVEEEKKAFGTYASEGGTQFTCAGARWRHARVGDADLWRAVSRERGGRRYRVKKPGVYGGYEIVTEVRVHAMPPPPPPAASRRWLAQKVSESGGLSREALLDKRQKKKADRMCN
jgi:hypothetical protein